MSSINAVSTPVTPHPPTDAGNPPATRGKNDQSKYQVFQDLLFGDNYFYPSGIAKFEFSAPLQTNSR